MEQEKKSNITTILIVLAAIIVAVAVTYMLMSSEFDNGYEAGYNNGTAVLYKTIINSIIQNNYIDLPVTTVNGTSYSIRLVPTQVVRL